MGLLERWARLAHRRRGRVILGWAVALAALITALSMFGGQYSNSFKLPGSEAQAAQDLLAAKFPARSGESSDIVFQAPAGIADPAIRARIEGLIAQIKTVPDVTSVDSPYDQPSYVAPSGTIARGVVQWDKTGKD